MAFAEATPRLPHGATILFQGDSITDGGRGRSLDPNHIFGQDYAYLIAAHCGGHFPEQRWSFLNRGISGNKITDLSNRWQSDALDLKPDILSILIGINDASSAINNNGIGDPRVVSIERYEVVYDQLIQSTLAILPKVKLVLCEPFILPVGQRVIDKWSLYSQDLMKRQEIVRTLADKIHAPFVPFQAVFTKACKRAPADYWMWDGIHPTAAGHQLMADEWLRVVNHKL